MCGRGEGGGGAQRFSVVVLVWQECRVTGGSASLGVGATAGEKLHMIGEEYLLIESIGYRGKRLGFRGKV